MLADDNEVRMPDEMPQQEPSAAREADAMLEGKVAVVTGSGRGIGRAHAMRLAAYGAKVVVNDLGVATDGSATDETPADGVVGEIRAAGGEAVADGHDISTAAGGEAVIQRALDEWGRIDVVVNNAGFGRPRMVFNLAEDEWDDVIRVHLKGTFSVTAPATRWWRSEHKAGRPVYGRVVNTATGLLQMAGAGQSNYTAAKAGCLAFTEAIATELAPYGVTANCILPGARTRLANVGWRTARNSALRSQAFDNQSPVHVAELVCYLASPYAQWISGQSFSVSGGRVEHVATFVGQARIDRDDRGWTVGDLRAEVPRMFGAGPHRADPPPREWSDQYHARGGSATAPA
jgi:NAD(P)-dependent dehydrogenase (short-subunit alcohol dehydrogenase family)